MPNTGAYGTGQRDRNDARRNRLLLRGLAAALLLLAPLPASAQTLDEVLSTTYSANPTLRAARASLRAVDEGVPQELSNWRPSVSASGSIGQRRVNSNGGRLGESGNTPLTPERAELSVTQPLYRGGRTVAGTQRAENEVLAERSRLRATEQDVLRRAVAAYMDVWRDQAVLEFNIQNEARLERQLQASRDRFEVGEVTRTDVAQAETRLAIATAGRIEAEGNLTASRAVFREVVGITPGQLDAPPQLGGLPGDLESAIAEALADNPNVLAARFTEIAARNEVRQVTGELLPSLNLRGSLTHQREANQPDARTSSVEILAELSVPLYQQGAVSSRVRQAKQLSSQRRLQITETRRQVEQETISAWEALQSARAQIVSFESSVRSAEIALEGVRQENLVGARTVLDVLDQEQELLDAQTNLARARRDEVVAAYDLLRAVGRLTAADLGLDVEIYDPQRHYRSVRDKWFGIGVDDSE